MAPDKSSSSSKKAPRKNSFLVQIYLILYNVAQVLGWSYLLYQVITYYTIPGLSKGVSLWDHVKWSVIIFQNAALLEVVHAATGIVPSNVALTLFQIGSRVQLVVGILMATPTAKTSFGLPLALFAWCITEIIRYSFYGFNLVNAAPKLLTWLRYSTFVFLYPIGVSGELICMYHAQQYISETGAYSMELPNVYNFTFSYLYLVWFLMFLYIPLFPKLYLHMFTLRRKVLGGGAAAASDKKKKVK